MLLYDGATPDSRFKCLLTHKIHHQAKYQRLNANTLYVAAILFSRSTLHREALPCLPNKNEHFKHVINFYSRTCTIIPTIITRTRAGVVSVAVTTNHTCCSILTGITGDTDMHWNTSIASCVWFMTHCTWECTRYKFEIL